MQRSNLLLKLLEYCDLIAQEHECADVEAGAGEHGPFRRSRGRIWNR
jgi:hypothetical protein